MSDRALQDRVLRALADAPYRASAGWRSGGLADPDRVERFARFLARHYYHERIVHFFKYSRVLARVTGRRPETVLRVPAFDALLASAVLGSRETARAVSALVVDHLETGSVGAVPYHRDLLRYQDAMMVVEAGPRVWRDQDRGGENGGDREEDGSDGLPVRVEGTVLLELRHDLPTVLPQLLRPWVEVPPAPVRPTPLLIARSVHGRVTVARGDSTVARVLSLADGVRTVREVASDAGLAITELRDTLRALTEVGAVRFSSGS
jgi:hypothetical protein